MVFAFVLAVAGPARADPAPLHAAPAPAATADEAADPAASPLFHPPLESLYSLPAARISLGGPGPDPAVRDLPAAPNSASLFLYAVGTLGAVQVSRSARRLQLGDVSAWLHLSGGPRAGASIYGNPFQLHAALPPGAPAAVSLWTYRPGPAPAADPPPHCRWLLERIGRQPRAPPDGRFAS